MAIPRNLSILAQGASASGVLSVTYGGTGVTTSTGTGSVVLSNSPSLTSPSVGSGNLTFSTTGQRITGDFSNATTANRLMFQSSTANGNTIVGALPNGTGTEARVSFYNSSDTANTSTFDIRCTATEAQLRTALAGTGTYLPMTFYTGGSERFRVGTSGQLGIGGANYGTSGQVLTSAGSGAAPTWSTPSSGGVTSLTAGNGITVSASTGAVTVSQDIYTGSTVANATYPIGTSVVVFDGNSIGAFAVNSSFTVWSPGVNTFRFSNASTGTGSVTLTGTWRVRGNNTASPDGYCLMQRTA